MSRFRFGPFVLDSRAGQLLRDSHELPLQPLVFALLHHLVQRPGELATRDELMQLLWPGVTVTDNSLEQVVRRARRALAPHDLLRTVPRRGYRLSAEVEPVDAPQRAGNLRPLPGRFVGRDAELADLRRRVERGERLLTLTGPGGAGKTALAHQLALSLDLPGWFVDLAPCTTELDVASAAARVLALGLEDADPAGHVGWALSRLGPALVLLDNFEHAVAAAPGTVGRWLRDAPDVVFIATSRIVLGLRGERPVPVAPLPPAEGLALLAERGGLSGQEPGCAELVRALDGLPLAIELAARRIRVLSPAQLLERIEDRFTVLTDPSPDRPDRHRSLEAALATSWDLLDDTERRALAQLTVFEGPVELAAAEAVVEVGRSVLDVLQGLVDQSLVRAMPPRFVLLDTIRAFATARATHDDRHAAERRHGRWFSRLRIQPDELADIVAAARRWIAHRDTELTVPCALAAAAMLRRTGPVRLAAELLEQSLEGSEGLARQRLLGSLVPTVLHDRPQLACRLGEEAVALARELDEPEREAVCRIDLSRALWLRGDADQAAHQLHEALRILRDPDTEADPYHEALALSQLGSIEGRRNRSQRALELHEEALAMFRGSGDLDGVATGLGNIGVEAEHLGRVEQAEQCYREALAIRRRQGNRASEASLLGNLAVLLFRSGQLDEGIESQREALRLAREIGLRHVQTLQLCNLGVLHLERGDHDSAAEVLDEALGLACRVGGAVREGHVRVALARLERERGALDLAAAHLDQAVSLLERAGDERLLAGALLERADLCLASGDLEGVTHAVAQVMVLSRGGRVLDPYARDRLRAVRQAIDSPG